MEEKRKKRKGKRVEDIYQLEKINYIIAIHHNCVQFFISLTFLCLHEWRNGKENAIAKAQNEFIDFSSLSSPVTIVD